MPGAFWSVDRIRARPSLGELQLTSVDVSNFPRTDIGSVPRANGSQDVDRRLLSHGAQNIGPVIWSFPDVRRRVENDRYAEL